MNILKNIFHKSYGYSCTRSKITPTVKDDGYIYSDGTTILGADDKAGLAAIIEFIHVINEQHLPHGQIQFVLTVGEEIGLEGRKQ